MAKFNNLDEFNSLLGDIITNMADQGKVTQLLTDIKDGVVDYNARVVSAEAIAEQLKIDNASLKESNFDIFRRYGTVVKSDDSKEDNSSGDDGKKQIAIEDIIDEKGRFKK